MKLVNQNQFQKSLKEFSKIEDARDQLWGRAQILIKKGFEIEAYILILATWNFARFRYFMKNFDLEEFGRVINKTKPVFNKLKKLKFEKVNLNDINLRKDIKIIYKELKKIAEQTGATKIMALKNPKLFIMWDTEIRRIYKIPNKATSTDYLEFLCKMKNIFGHIKWRNKNMPIAKAIDEYNYVKVDKIRKLRKDRLKISKKI